jgi:uncharacterized protein
MVFILNVLCVFFIIFVIGLQISINYVANNGVGITNEGYTVPADGNWGESTWLGRDLYNLSQIEFDKGVIMDMVLDASQLITNQQVNAFINAGMQYFRLEPQLSQDEDQMDNISQSNIDSLTNTAQSYIRTQQSAFQEILQILKMNM